MKRGTVEHLTFTR